MKDLLKKLIEGVNLEFAEAHLMMNNIMEGKLNNSEIAAVLTALKIKGETSEEIGAFAKAMREKSVKISVDGLAPIDVCGTGGDSSGTFNISTTAAFVVAGLGIPVAKHGNRSVSSKSGSADVLKELGVNIELTKEQSAQALAEVGIAFLFAPLYHPAMKYAAPVRKELGIKTVFNILGPLTNPAGTKKQVIGVFNNRTARLMAEAAEYLDMDKVCFVCTDDRYDEITLTGTAKVFEYEKGKGIREFEITAETLGLTSISLSEIKGDSASTNAQILLNIFEGNDSDALNVTAANAALGLYAADYSTDIKECFRAALDSINSGKALERLNRLKEFGEIVK